MTTKGAVMRRNYITYKILFVIIVVSVITSISVLTVIDYKLTEIADETQKMHYYEQLDLIISRLESYQKSLLKTGIEDIYIDDYQQLSLSKLRNNYYKTRDQNAYPIIVNDAGVVLLSKEENLGKALYRETHKFSAAKSGNIGDSYFEYTDEKYWAIYKYFPVWKWEIAFVMPVSFKYRSVEGTKNTLAIIMITSAIVTILLLVIILTRIIRPIVQLTKVVDRISGGNLNQDIDVQTNDEIGRLALAFDKMRMSIVCQIEHLNDEVVERKKAEKQLLITLNSIGDAVISTDRSGLIVHMNPVAVELTGWSLDEALGKPLLEVLNIIDPDTHEQCINPVNNVVESDSVVYVEDNTILVAKGGVEYNIADSGAPIRDDEGNIIGVVIVFRDVTEKYKLEYQLRHSEKMQAVGQLAGGIAHDFNNMLGGIIGATEILHKFLDGSEQAETSYSIILNASDRAAKLVQQLLAFARKKEIGSTLINVHAVVRESVSLLERTIDKAISIKCSFCAKTDTIIGDPSQLQNIIINLGINASHEMPHGGTISFSSKNVVIDDAYCSSSNFSLVPGEYIELEVRDSGRGIAPEIIDRVFEPFFTTKANDKGTGLGLSVVYGSVIQHHGAIRIDSTLNKYTAFIMLFPISHLDHSYNHFAKSTSIQEGKGTILFVEDEPVMRATAEIMLQNAGYKVITAENGRIGLNKYKQYKDSIDLIILDMIMPEMNGKDCFNKIRDIDPNVKVILASGFSQEDDIKMMKQRGLNSFISKPYRSSELTSLIASVLNNEQNE